MSFISYAQNFEDVMLWRALKHIQHGFYIDVGANDPTLYSVTRAFYDRAWCGINIEPVEQYYKRLQEQRPNDINLQIGAGQTAGSFPFFDIPDTGLATSDAVVAQKHRAAGWDVQTTHVPVLPLADICCEHVRTDIHFLKIDVEGAEKGVLQGMNFQAFRPWLVVVEATAPMSQDVAYQSWEYLLTEARYDFIYFDGLNRFYVAQEHPELKPAFDTPPNVFDGFVLNADQESKLRASEAEASAQRARQQLLVAQKQAAQALESEQQARNSEQQAINEARQITSQLTGLLASTSWRITRPLRILKRLLGMLRQPSGFIRVTKIARNRVKLSQQEVAPTPLALSPSATRVMSDLLRAVGDPQK